MTLNHRPKRQKHANTAHNQVASRGSIDTSQNIRATKQNTGPKPLGSKHPPQRSLRELEGEEQRRALNMMKHSLYPMMERMPTQDHVNESACLEYQKASSLYDAVKLASTRTLYNFDGCHSIVRFDDIDHYKRAKLVAKDLRKIAKVPFKYDVPLQRVTNTFQCRRTYSCTCTSSTTRVLSSSTSSNKAISAASPSPSVAIANGHSATNDIACGGRVIITVQDDRSHFLGILGQQIIVKIIH